MEAARRLRERFRIPEYKERYERWRKDHAPPAGDDEAWLETRLLPDPELARVRVYTTHSTHKTLTSLRQGSMIHVHDQHFEHEIIDSFDEAYMTHTSTSPNYQIIASLDVGRRQVELDGYELVQHAIELALILRRRVSDHPLLRKYFRMLDPADLIPAEARTSGFATYNDLDTDWQQLDRAWRDDELCLDPTRLTLHIGETGLGGEAFKYMLMDRFDIQINKTARNTVLFMTHIGTSRSSVAHLIEALTLVARELDERREERGRRDRQLHQTAVSSLTEEAPALPDFSRFHDAFRPDPDAHGAHGGHGDPGVRACPCASSSPGRHRPPRWRRDRGYDRPRRGAWRGSRTDGISDADGIRTMVSSVARPAVFVFSMTRIIATYRTRLRHISFGGW